jgi:hypothetical protein
VIKDSAKRSVSVADLVRRALIASAALASVGAAQSALALTCPSTTFCLSDTVTTNSSGTVTVTNTGYPDNGSPTSPISSLTSFTLGDAFGSGQTAFGSQFTTTQTGGQLAPGATAPNSGWNFYDDYRFTINPGSTIDTAVISVNSPASGTEVTDLEVRLFQAGPNGTAPNPPGSTLGAPTGGTLVDSWSTVFPGGSYVYTMPKGFSAGSYELQVRGLAANGSSYGGNIEFTPVPLPAAAWLMASAVGALGVFRRRRGVVAPQSA